MKTYKCDNGREVTYDEVEEIRDTFINGNELTDDEQEILYEMIWVGMCKVL